MRLLEPLRVPALLTCTLLASCSREAPDGGGAPAAARVEDTVARDRVAGLVAEGEIRKAREALRPLVERKDAAFEDLVRATVVELKDNELSAAQSFLARAAELGPDEAAVHYLRGRVAELLGEDLEAVAEHYRRALELAPDDPASKYLLASSYSDLGRDEEALALARELEALGPDNGGPWYVSGIYKISSILRLSGTDEEAARAYQDLYSALDRRGLKAVTAEQLTEGTLARVAPPEPDGNHPLAPPAPPTYAASETILPELGGGAELLALDLDGDRRVDVLSAGERGIALALRAPSGGWGPVARVETEAARLVRAIDLGKDDTLDLVYVSGSALRILECEGAPGEERWSPSPLALPTFASPPADLALVDFDHDGDLDLFLAGDFGGRLLRNDGAGIVLQDGQPLPRGAFVDASAEAGLPTDAGWRWCATEDLDGDQDVDLLLGGPDKLYVGSSLRGGRFEDVAGRVLPGAALPSAPLLADFDGDARPDLLLPGEPASLFVQGRDGVLARRALESGPSAQPLEVDLDLDGTVDVVWAAGGALRGAFALGLATARNADCSAAGAAGPGPLACADLESGHETELAWELLQLGPDGVTVFRTRSPLGNAIRVRFRGVKDNRQGIGAIVELRAGGLYRRHYWRGPTMLYGLSSKKYCDVLRVTWPNGVVQNELDVERGNQILEGGGGFGEQPEGLSGSCPFLYTWNGERHEFVTDVLGITPLGLPMAPGQLVPPDHDEYVLVRGEQLVPDAEGRLVLQLTEELREVTYLDRVRLDVVDHPLGSEVWPNERFCFPPFPEAHTHVLAAPVAPARAMGSDGRDWTEALAAVDDVHAIPFRPLADGQFLGLAEPHSLTLEFDREALVAGAQLRLVCTGWFYWTDASVNVATARTPGLAFVPPILEVPDADGWRAVGPPVGFPAGKTKSMVLDVTDVLSPADPRLRLSSTLRLYWDSIRLFVGPDGEQRTSSLEAESARLWPRGFSAPIATGREDLPERFEWERLAPIARWDQHPGRYTRYGETLPLVREIDDRFVVLGSGDALTLRFDGRSLPLCPPGWRRDYLLFLDGWAKDRDPNTVEALTVEPLPFHGMSGYPYPPGESFPATDLHRAWLSEWQTRPAYRHLVPLSPVREGEWLAEQRSPQPSRSPDPGGW